MGIPPSGIDDGLVPRPARTTALQLTTTQATRLPPALARPTVRDRGPAGALPISVGVAAAVVGALVLIGWATNVAVLKSAVPGILTMKANTALCFVLMGTGIALLAWSPRGSRRWSIGVVLVLAAATIAVLTGSQYLIGRDFGIDQLLFSEARGQVGTVVPGRMSPLTAICFGLLGTATLLAAAGRGRRLVLGIVSVAILVSALNVLVVVFDAGVPLFLAGYTQMALNTAVTMAALAFGVVGLLAESPFAPLLGPSSSATLLRRLLAVALIVPVLIAWLRLEGQKAGWYGTSYGTSLMLVGIVTLIVIAIFQSAHWAAAIDQRREASELERDRFFELSLDLLTVVGADGRFQRVNHAWKTVLGYSVEALVGHSYLEFIHSGDVEATIAASRRQYEPGQPGLQFLNRYRHVDGTYRWLEWTSQRDPDRSVAFAVGRDVTERQLQERRGTRERRLLKNRNASLTKWVSHDPLTGLHNRRFFDRALAGIERRRGRLPIESRPPVSVVIFDLDHFGDLNKQYGHQVGDAVLRVFAGLLKKRFRGDDLVARYGGEEFVAVLEGATSADAARLADGVRATFEKLSVPSGTGEPLRATVSAGCAQLDGDGGVLAALTLADVWLAQAKRAGRNQVIGL